jgi:hypothetical protein
MAIARSAVVMVLSGCVLAACDGGSSAGLTFDQYAARANDVVCAINVRCGSIPDKASCVSALDGLEQAKADVQSGKTIFDGVAGAACLDAFDDYDCRASTDFTGPEACEQTAKGTLADGAACSTSAQCVSGTCSYAAVDCDRQTTCCPGTCAPTRVIVAEGGACGGDSQACDTGLYCDSLTSPAVCKKRGALGATCGTFTSCLSTLTCVRAAGATTGTCTAYPKRGEPCTASAFSICDDAHDFCDPATTKCAARLAVGADCTAATEGCVRYAACDPTSHLCVKKPGLGQPCAEPGDCLGSLDCVNGTCAVDPPRIVCP